MVDTLPNNSAPPDLRSKRAYPGIDIGALDQQAPETPHINLKKTRAIQDPVHGLISFDDLI